MSLYEWLLFLHVLAAFLLVTGLAAFGVLALGAGGDAARRALAPVATLWDVGGLGTILFGVWLALNVDGYELWDGWILAAIVLWAVAAGAGGRLARGVREGAPDRAQALYAVMAVATLLLLIDMIFKPGA